MDLIDHISQIAARMPKQIAHKRMGVGTRSYWLPHRGGNRNLAGLLCSDIELSVGLVPTNLKAESRA